MDYVRNLFASIITGIIAYLAPISGDMKSLLAIFVLNFIFGLLSDLLIHRNGFSFKKAWKCIWEATVLFLLISAIYYIGECKHNPDGALQCISFVTYSAFYFYGLNILKNLKELLPDGSSGWKVVSFLYFILSVEFVKKIPHLSEYLGVKEVQHDGE